MVNYLNASSGPLLMTGQIGNFEFKVVEKNIQEFWKSHHTYQKAKQKNDHGPKFYYLDGPPYTSGNIHLGHAWGKALRDMVMRHKRMRGFNVWDRAGFDMHGLPTEHATMKKYNIKTTEEIQEFGVDRFIEACREWCVTNMEKMIEDFRNFGVWMDFDHPYQSISRDFIEGEWWFVKTAYEKGRLYEGERTMTWDAVNATALAKHELEYKTITDTAIYVKFPVHGHHDTYFIIWTTTPWTIPFNLAIMANPELTYCKIKVTHEGKTQQWYIAKDRLEPFLNDQLKTEYEILEEIKGSELEGMSYTHPFAQQNHIYAELKKKMPKTHTVLMSQEYVDTSAGTGLVHCAPGCGPEDYEVGHRNGIKPFNTIDENGICRELKPFEGLAAKTDDDEFIRLIGEHDALVFAHKYSHEYPHGERSHKPVIFRTTKQWFLKVEDIKEKLIEENNKITWVPEAAYNAFNSWLENLRDNSISKQRYWGTPIPIWRNINDPSDFIIVGSAKELVELAGLDKIPDDLHKPTVDNIIIKRKKDGKMHEYKRIPDVLDVWVDAGTVSWNCLYYPLRKDLFEKWFPADFILEGKDQIRGWFNLLHLASMIALDRPAFKAVYMHGFINDAQGRKMSKSLGNYILPTEVTQKYGVDAVRYYMIGAANPGFDMNYNFDDLDAKFKNLLVYWNMHKYTIELAQLNDITPTEPEEIGTEERYLLSKLHSTIKKVTQKFDTYQLNEIPLLIENFLLEMSRTYIQLIRDKASAGTDSEKAAVVHTLFKGLTDAMTLFAPLAPYFTEQVYKHMAEIAPYLKEESIHLRAWPVANDDMIDEQLEQDFVVARDAIAAVLAARDKAQLGVRWPVKEVRFDCTTSQRDAIKRLADLIKVQTNIKEISFEDVAIQFTIAPNTKTLGKEFGKETQHVMKLIEEHQEELSEMLQQKKEHAVIDNKTIKAEHLDITRKLPDKYQAGEGNSLRAYLDTTRTPELEREGFAREVIRRIQQLRKNAGLVKSNRIHVEIVADQVLAAAIKEHTPAIAERTGADKLSVVHTISQHYEHTSKEQIKGANMLVGFTVK